MSECGKSHYLDVITFAITCDVIRNHPEAVRKLFERKGLIVLKAEFDYGRDAVDYTAWTGSTLPSPGSPRPFDVLVGVVSTPDKTGWVSMGLELLPRRQPWHDERDKLLKRVENLTQANIGATNDRDIAEANLANARHELAELKAGRLRRFLAWLRGHSPRAR